MLKSNSETTLKTLIFDEVTDIREVMNFTHLT